MGLGLPKGFLMADESDNVRGAALQQQDIVFQRKLPFIQHAYLKGVKKMLTLIAYYLGANLTTLNIDVKIKLPHRLSQDMLEQYKSSIEFISQVKQLIQDINPYHQLSLEDINVMIYKAGLDPEIVDIPGLVNIPKAAGQGGESEESEFSSFGGGGNDLGGFGGGGGGIGGNFEGFGGGETPEASTELGGAGEEAGGESPTEGTELAGGEGPDFGEALRRKQITQNLLVEHRNKQASITAGALLEHLNRINFGDIIRSPSHMLLEDINKPRFLVETCGVVVPNTLFECFIHKPHASPTRSLLEPTEFFKMMTECRGFYHLDDSL